jgi:hypothetical protein
MSDETESPSDATPPAPEPPPPEALEPALACLARGDFAGARAAAERVLRGQPTPEEAAAARALLDRLAVDPWALRVGVAAVFVLALLVARYVV